MNRQTIATASVRQMGRRRILVCATCATHKRPEHVPWHQHTIGCKLREAELTATFRSAIVANH